jgi:tetratricopeptide (TPR) repeat protein
MARERSPDFRRVRGAIAVALAVCAASEPPSATPAAAAGRGPVIHGSIIPLSYRDGRYSALVQLLADGSPLAGAQWDLRLRLSTDGRIVHGDSAIARTPVAWLPVVFEREIEIAPGRHVVSLDVRESHPDRGGIDGSTGVQLYIDWPEPTAKPVVVGSIAVMQPLEALFVRSETVVRVGPVNQVAQQPIDPARPTYMVSLVCRGNVFGRVYVQSQLAGGSTRGTGSHEPALEHDPCAQIRDLIPASKFPIGTARYELQVTLLPKGPPVAEEAIEVAARARSVQETQSRDTRRQQVEALVEHGSAALAKGELEPAALAFDRAFGIEPHPAIAALRDQARDRLDLRSRGESNIAEGLGRARAFAENGQVGAALGEAETVVALDPGNPQAVALRDELAERQRRDRTEAERQTEIAQLKDRIAELTAQADHAGALAAANRVLSLDPGNAAAQRQLAESYRALGDGSPERANQPPVIEFFLRDAPRDAEAEITTAPLFVLGGSVIDESDVGLRFVDGDVELDEPTLRSRVVQGVHITDFVLRHRLGPALSLRRSFPRTLTAIATDRFGTVVRRDHAVVYRVPFYRSLGVYAGAISALTLGGATVVGLRVRGRRRRLRRRFNPYIVGAPVLRQEQFYGRERLIQRVLQAIPNNSVLLYGERRIGKTSLQHRLYRRLKGLDDPDYTFFPVFIDLQGTPEERFFRTMMREVVDELGSRLDGLDALPLAGNPAEYGHAEFVRDIGTILHALARGTTKPIKLVLQIDEIDELNGYDPRINQRLRSLFSRGFSESLVAVVSGVAIRKDWASHGSPWYNFFEEIEVREFDRGDAEDLVRRPIEGTFRLDAGVVQRVVEISGCKPYRIQRLCTELVSRAHEARRGRITVEDVEAVREHGES